MNATSEKGGPLLSDSNLFYHKAPGQWVWRVMSLSESAIIATFVTIFGEMQGIALVSYWARALLIVLLSHLGVVLLSKRTSTVVIAHGALTRTCCCEVFSCRRRALLGLWIQRKNKDCRAANYAL